MGEVVANLFHSYFLRIHTCRVWISGSFFLEYLAYTLEVNQDKFQVGGTYQDIVNYSFATWKGFDAIKVNFNSVNDSDCHFADNFHLSYCLNEMRVPYYS